MQVITTVTQKGQITVPKAMRDKLGIKAYGAVVMDINKSQITVKPVQDVVDLAGSFKTKVTKSPLAARAEMEKYYERV